MQYIRKVHLVEQDILHYRSGELLSQDDAVILSVINKCNEDADADTVSDGGQQEDLLDVDYELPTEDNVNLEPFHDGPGELVPEDNVHLVSLDMGTGEGELLPEDYVHVVPLDDGDGELLPEDSQINEQSKYCLLSEEDGVNGPSDDNDK